MLNDSLRGMDGLWRKLVEIARERGQQRRVARRRIGCRRGWIRCIRRESQKKD
jgi:hypothetical protein